ncbi:molybdopterin molybdotransferase MoeA [Cyanobacteria bacterium FACHB-DQ100]|uniref:molybdopterin molybdotransferase MoeA n=1 Tax=Leptolyngbya sp. DQ-M1 TaxID=2933920 RepID=UPI00198C24E9|nr:molybdopterin molybdotransferase MoeA [Cyanobacteria bacterium FACHB-DQ100]
MLSVVEAETLILESVQAIGEIERVGLAACRNRILAAPIASNLDFPHWDNSAMDGYAVRFEDVKQPAILEIVEEIPAGYLPQKSIQPGQAARILTGSMMPAGADTVVMQENTQRQGDRVSILTPPPTQGSFVRYRGSYYQAGNPLLSPGAVLKAPEIAILAAAQCVEVPVFRRLRVAILSTGSELVTPDRPLQPGQIVDSNQYALEALVAEMGAEVISLGIICDEPAELKNAIATAVESADVVISSGGVSVGDYDYVDRILEELGAAIQIRSVAVKPGKPLTFATFPNSTLYFGLPGNPASVLVTFWRFAQPAIRKLSGLGQGWKPEFLSAIATQELKSDGKREFYLWGSVSISDGVLHFTPAGGSRLSGNLINLAGTNALGKMSIGQTHISPGETIQILKVS